MTTTRPHLASSDEAAPGVMTVRRPANGRVVGSVPDVTPRAAGILKFCREKAIISERFTLEAEPQWRLRRKGRK